MTKSEITMPKAKKNKEEQQKEGRVWRAVVAVILVVVVTVVAMGLNGQFDGVSANKIINAAAVDDGDEEIDWGRYPTYDIILTESVLINKAGTYRLTGVLEDGMIMVDVKNTVARLILDNVVIRNTGGPAIYIEEGEDVVIEVVGDNYIEDGTTYEGHDEKVNGAIYSRQDLTLTGEGALVVVGNLADGIVSKDDVKFVSGTYTITAVDDGVRGKDSVQIMGGNLTIAAGGDAIKATNEQENGKGFVLVQDGELDLTATGKGIEAVETAFISGGKTVITAKEGVEARTVVITDGELNISTIDDGINAKNDAQRECLILISGGTVRIAAMAGDGLDSNGKIMMNGGRVVVDGPSTNEDGALDSEYGITFDGGELLAAGYSGMTEVPDVQTSSAPSVSLYFTKLQDPGTEVQIFDADGELILMETFEKNFTHLVAGSERFKLGEGYRIYVNGEMYKDFVMTNLVTKVVR